MTNTLLLAAPGYWLLIDQSLIRNIADFSQSDYHDHSLLPHIWWQVSANILTMVWSDELTPHRHVKGLARLSFYNFLWKFEILLLLINQFDILSTTIFSYNWSVASTRIFWLQFKFFPGGDLSYSELFILTIDILCDLLYLNPAQSNSALVTVLCPVLWIE